MGDIYLGVVPLDPNNSGCILASSQRSLSERSYSVERGVGSSASNFINFELLKSTTKWACISVEETGEGRGCKEEGTPEAALFSAEA